MGQERAPPQDQDAFFGLTKRWDVHIAVDEADWETLYPTRRGGMLSQRGVYPYIRADVEIAGHRVAEVGLRFKGNSTFWMTSGSLKRSFKLDFDRYREGQRWLGLKKLNLHNNATDPTQLREAVSHSLYRASGVPAPRTCFARVFLTLPGRCIDEYLGSYTVTEQVDRSFVKRSFGSKRGSIFKPEGRTIPDLKGPWGEAHERVYIPKTAVDAHATGRLVEFARLVHEADDKELDGALDEVLDTELFLRYVAVTTIIVNLDSPMMIPHNYYLVVPDGGRIKWVPWDLNLSLGGFVMAGPAQARLSLMEPSYERVFTRLLAMPRLAKRYKEIAAELIEGPCSSKSMITAVRAAQKTIASAVAYESVRSEVVTRAPADPTSRGFSLSRWRDARRPDRSMAQLEKFLVDREKSVLDQLAGRAEGRRIGFGRWRSRRRR